MKASCPGSSISCSTASPKRPEPWGFCLRVHFPGAAFRMGWLIADMALGPHPFSASVPPTGPAQTPVIACSPLTWIEYTSAKKSRQPAGRLLFFFCLRSAGPEAPGSPPVHPARSVQSPRCTRGRPHFKGRQLPAGRGFFKISFALVIRATGFWQPAGQRIFPFTPHTTALRNLPNGAGSFFWLHLPTTGDFRFCQMDTKKAANLFQTYCFRWPLVGG